jgi:mRNA interferase RelE/StbE
MASVEWTTPAKRDAKGLEHVIVRRVIQKLIWVEENFSSFVPEPLHLPFKGLYKLRVGDYRVVYSLENDVITIQAVRHRSEAYS